MPIPYFEQPTLNLGPLSIHAFGVLVMSAIWLGSEIIRRRATTEQLDSEKASRLAAWIWMPGLIVAHVFDRVVYYPAELIKDPLSIFWIWKSLSSFGGFLGAVLGAWLFTRRHKTKPNTWRYLDLVAYAFVFGWILGRLGCALAYDHPGSETTSFVAQYYHDGKARFNLGMLEAAYFVPLAAIFYVLGRRPRPAGFYVGLLCLVYAPFRFFLDFARYIDVRYFGLTPAQWGSLAVTAVGIGIMVMLQSRPRPDAVAEPALPIAPSPGA